MIYKKHIKKITRKIDRANPDKLKRPLLVTLSAFTILFTLIIGLLIEKVKREVDDLKLPDSQSAREIEIRKLVEGYPIEEMVPYIASKDKVLAAFLVSIAKKESNWGKRVPVLDGQDCFNYWGYRGKSARMGTGGHTCFSSPEDAVETVSKRLAYFIEEKKLDSPEEMVVWKCGWNCSWDDRGNVRKWISDVDWYFSKLVE